MMYNINMEDFRLKLVKKIKYLSSKRAILENEIILKKFFNYVIKNYNTGELIEYCKFLENFYDSDLFDVIIGKKNPENFREENNVKFLLDIKNFVRNLNE